MAEASKDTIYIDVDDDITSIIDKVNGSSKKIVALVLPKRATALQSIVNMKLLKRKADSNKKGLVLITSEASLLPLAGAVKLHVAKTLQSKPAIPAAPKVPSDDLSLDDDLAAEDSVDYEDDQADDLPDESAALSAKPTPEDTIELDNTESDNAEDSKKTPAQAKNNKLKIPNFNQFRKKFLIGGAVLFGLLIFWILGTFVLPTAKIVITTDNVSVNTDVNVTLDSTAEKLDVDQGIVPAVSKSVKKTDADKVPATGKKNVGEKATGTVSIKLDNCPGGPVTVPSGTKVVNDGLSFVLQQSVTFYPYPQGNTCANDLVPTFTRKTIDVVAAEPGGKFNLSGGRTFTVTGFSNVSGYDSSSMTGGTDKTVKVVSQGDIDKAKESFKDKSKDAAIQELKEQFSSEDLFALPDTLINKDQEVTTSPDVGEEADEVTVTSITTFTMLGAKRDDLKAVVVKAAESQIDTSKQKISEDGLDKAVFKSDLASKQKQKVEIQSTVSTGAAEDTEALKTEITGKKKGQIKDLLSNRPGVSDVQVNFSPFWVASAPKTSKITIEYKQSTSDSSQ